MRVRGLSPHATGSPAPGSPLSPPIACHHQDRELWLSPAHPRLPLIQISGYSIPRWTRESSRSDPCLCIPAPLTLQLLPTAHCQDSVPPSKAVPRAGDTQPPPPITLGSLRVRLSRFPGCHGSSGAAKPGEWLILSHPCCHQGPWSLSPDTPDAPQPSQALLCPPEPPAWPGPGSFRATTGAAPQPRLCSC